MALFAEHAWKRIWAALDANGDGELSFDELALIDEDGDGTLDRAELLHAMNKLTGMSVSEEEYGLVDHVRGARARERAARRALV